MNEITLDAAIPVLRIYDVAKAREFFSLPVHSPPGTEVELARVLESGGDCIGLRAREGAAVTRYLTHRVYNAGVGNIATFELVADHSETRRQVVAVPRCAISRCHPHVSSPHKP